MNWPLIHFSVISCYGENAKYRYDQEKLPNDGTCTSGRQEAQQQGKKKDAVERKPKSKSEPKDEGKKKKKEEKKGTKKDKKKGEIIKVKEDEKNEEIVQELKYN